MRIAFYTLGCKANQYDTQAMISVLEHAGHEMVDFGQFADAYIINSCTVTAESDRKTRQVIGRARRSNPDALVVVSGCYAQRDAEKVLAIDGVDAVTGSSDRQGIAGVLERARKGKPLNAVAQYGDSCEYEEVAPLSRESTQEARRTRDTRRVRAHIKIQDGCDRFCTYCIIPYVRGPVRCRSAQGIAAAAQAAGESGCNEVVLTGIRIASYGNADGGSLMDAVDAANGAESVYRIRLGSLDPDEINEGFVARAASCDKLCRHFHLSLQSGCDSVLKRMGRRYTIAQYADIMNMMLRYMPDASFTTDLMVGFVGETQLEFEQSMSFVQQAGFARVHIFPYSVREGTAAARMQGHLENAVKLERAHIMNEVASRMEADFASAMVGNTLEIVVEPAEGSEMQGYARNYCRVAIPAEFGLEGKVANVKIDGSRGGIALGNVREIIV